MNIRNFHADFQFSEWLAPPNCGFDNKDYKSHDIMILELESEVEFSDGTSSVAVGPICLPKPGDVGNNLTLSYLGLGKPSAAKTDVFYTMCFFLVLHNHVADFSDGLLKSA